MRITNIAIRRRLTVYVLIALIVVAGMGSYISLPRESFPEVKIPLILVYTIYGGVSPEDIETLLTRPIETELKAISGIKEIRSTSSEGISVIEVEFNPEVDLDTAIQKVREKVDLAKPELPQEAEDSRIQDVDVSQFPILVVSLSGQVGLAQLKEISDDLKDELEAIPGVNRVQVIGGREREVHVYADPRRLSFYELSLVDLVTAVSQDNLTVPGGEIDVGSLKYLVRLPAEVERPAEIEDFVVEVRDGGPIYVRDVARVVFGFEDETTRSRLDGTPSVTLTIEKRTGANIIEVADTVKEELERVEATWPPGTEVTVVGDVSHDIRMMVSELENNIISGLILVVLVLMAFLGFRNSVFVAVAIPLSMLLSFSVIQMLGYTLNMIVLFSLILVLGMLVDNAVVIVENIYRHREEGKDGPTAASVGTDEVAIPVIASTITTLCAFGPMLFWPGIVGDFMSYLPVTLIIGLTASLVVALIFNPTLTAYFMKPPSSNQGGSWKQGVVLTRYRQLLGWVLEATDTTERGWFYRNWALLLIFVACVVVGCRGFRSCELRRGSPGPAALPPHDVALRSGRCCLHRPRDHLAGMEPLPPPARLATLCDRSSLRSHLERGGDPRGHDGCLWRPWERTRILSRNRAAADSHRRRVTERRHPRDFGFHRETHRRAHERHQGPALPHRQRGFYRCEPSGLRFGQLSLQLEPGDPRSSRPRRSPVEKFPSNDGGDPTSARRNRRCRHQGR